MRLQDASIHGRVGQTVGGQWRLDALIGSGGTAAVYAATRADGTRGAVKILHAHITHDPEIRERLLREVSAANAIEHEGAVRVLAHGQDGDLIFIVMELLEGAPLSELAKEHGPMAPDVVLGYLEQALDVLAAAHDKSIVHRDFKPDNLFLTNRGRLKVLDFGLARRLEDAPGDFKTQTGMALGTLPYMAPEQALGRRAEVDGRTDLFAVGATAFRLLTGRRVHTADSEAELLVLMATKPAPSLGDVAPAVPAGMRAIVDVALAFSRDARYPDARTMLGDVRAVRAGLAPPFASARLAADCEMTRVDRVAPSVSGAGVAAVTTERAGLSLAPPRASDAAARRRMSRRGAWVVAALVMLCLGGATAAATLVGRTENPSAEEARPAPQLRGPAEPEPVKAVAPSAAMPESDPSRVADSSPSPDAVTSTRAGAHPTAGTPEASSFTPAASSEGAPAPASTPEAVSSAAAAAPAPSAAKTAGLVANSAPAPSSSPRASSSEEATAGGERPLEHGKGRGKSGRPRGRRPRR